jgi:hypothetical protein
MRRGERRIEIRSRQILMLDDLAAIRDSAHKGWALCDKKKVSDMIEVIGDRRAKRRQRREAEKHCLKNGV